MGKRTVQDGKVNQLFTERVILSLKTSYLDADYMVTTLRTDCERPVKQQKARENKPVTSAQLTNQSARCCNRPFPSCLCLFQNESRREIIQMKNDLHENEHARKTHSRKVLHQDSF